MMCWLIEFKQIKPTTRAVITLEIYNLVRIYDTLIFTNAITENKIVTGKR